jgi:hypothetical protein
VAARLALATAWTPVADAALAAVAAEAARATGDPALIVAGFDALQAAAVAEGRTEDALRHDRERQRLAAQLDPSDPYQASEIEDAISAACLSAVAEGDLPTARSVAEFTLTNDLLEDHPFLTLSKTIPAFVLSGDLDEAARLADTMWDAWQAAGLPPTHWLRISLPFVVLAHGLRGDHQQVAAWQARTAELTDTPGPIQLRRAQPLPIFAAARIAAHSGDLQDAATLVEQAKALPVSRYVAYARSTAAELAVVAQLPDAQHLLDLARSEGDHPWAAACLARAAGRLHGDADRLTESAERWERLGARVERACTLLLLPERADEGRAELTALGVSQPG